MLNFWKEEAIKPKFDEITKKIIMIGVIPTLLSWKRTHKGCFLYACRKKQRRRSKMEWVYLNDAHNTCRYILGTVGCHPLVCIGVNPSTAEPNKLDNTLKSVARIAAQNGYDSWIMLNLYPQRATNPNDLHTAPNTGWMEQNIKHISQLLEKHPNAHLWAAWGNLIERRPYLAECLYQIRNVAQNHNCQWVTFGRTSVKGHPHHPLYLKTTSPRELFDIQTYQPKKRKHKKS